MTENHRPRLPDQMEAALMEAGGYRRFTFNGRTFWAKNVICHMQHGPDIPIEPARITGTDGDDATDTPPVSRLEDSP